MKDEILHPKILDFVSHLFIFVRLGTINSKVKEKNDKSQKNVQSVHGCKKTAQLSAP
jgi:hypothetical protein